MSEPQRASVDPIDEAPPRLEPWLVVTLLAFVPGALIFVLPPEIVEQSLVLIGAAIAGFFFVGLAMFIKRTRG